MTNRSHGKIRSQQTWNEIRRAWERGETGASLALRYDGGLSNLWRRRAAEGWRRLRGEDPAPEPLEGWARFAVTEREAFNLDDLGLEVGAALADAGEGADDRG